MERQARSPVLADKEQALFVVSNGAKWCVGHASAGRKFQVECAVLANRETVPIATLFRAK
jgi:hypothetical protein